MKPFHCLLILALLGGPRMLGAAGAVDAYPSESISNGVVRLDLYLPDAEKGFYRSTRFDWSGMIRRVEYKGHVFFGPWKEKHDPLGTDDVIGPAEEFGMDRPLGYSDAQVGQTFIKIGVGELQKIDEPNYRFFGQYRMVRPGQWTVRRGGDWIEFQQDLAGERGYAYRYIKRISLGQQEPGFVIDHRLKNTGTRPIDTNHYNHNFTSIDNEPIGPAYRLSFPFPVKPHARPAPNLQGVTEFQGTDITFSAPLEPGKPVWVLLDGFAGPEHHGVVVRNTRTNAAIAIRGDQPLEKYAFYAASTAACPEPFIRIKLAPGEEKAWSTHYALRVGAQ